MRSLLIALALLALLTHPAAAQTGSITITIDCGDPESIAVVNDTDETIVLETLNSSENQTSENEIDLDDTEVASGVAALINYGSATGGGNIFNNDLTETATVTISGEDYQLTCEMGGTTTETFQLGSTPPAPTAPPPPVVETPGTVAEATAVTDTKMPGKVGGGGMAAASGGLPVGSITGGVSLLLLSGYALLRRR